MGKKIYPHCELCGKEVFDVKDCVEVLISTKLCFMNSIPQNLNKINPTDAEFDLGGGFVTICADCFFTKDSIKKALLSRWAKNNDLSELAQINYDSNPQHFKRMKTKSKNKVLLKIIEEKNKIGLANERER